MAKEQAPEESVIDEAIRQDSAAASSGRFGWLGSTVAVIFGLVYAYYVWDAMRSLVELPGYYRLIGLTDADVPWWLLIIGLLVPIVVYATAFLLARRRNFAVKALLFFVGLTVVATLGLSVIALEAVIRPAAALGL